MRGKILKVIKNPYAFSVLSEFCGIMVAFLFTIFQARFLGPEIKGQVAIINSMVGITAIVFGLGINQAYPYFRKNNNKIDILPIFMKMAFLMLVLYMSISTVAVISLKLSLVNIAVFIITPLMVYDGIVSDITLVEVPNRRNATNMLVNISELLFVLILWVTAKPNLILGIIIIVFKHVIKSLVFTFWWRRRIFVKTKSIRCWIARLVKFGFFPMLAVLMSTLNYRIDVLMLNGHVTDAAIGIYSVGVLLADRMWMIPDAMKGVMVSNITKGRDAHEATYVIRICNTICVFIIIGIIMLGSAFIDFVFGAEYKGAYSITLILLTGVFPMINYKVIASYNNVIGKQNMSFFMLSTSVFLNVVANYILIPIYGIYGAGIASVASYAVCSILFIAYFCKITRISYREMIVVNRNDCKRFWAMLSRNRNS